ncbi:GNAT family protein [Winogradskyella maritima]|uniref:GNAT family N-acetyltransferase n=1 Tax=Winogradskyella maritima TaxID=1517766 RepID=A0ABV8AHP3_9FLAO|nr:GNAT family protein [Winogradskyella maritima]
MNTENIILENSRARLELLTMENYELLNTIASEKDLIYYSPSNISTPTLFKNYVETAVKGYVEKTILPFIIYDKQLKDYAGSTRFGLISNKNKTLHIGWTWMGKKFQGTGLNTAIKTLMLTHAFEDMQFEKVEFRIDERNGKSRRAVEKLGATLEGILRKDTVMKDGFRRSTCCYGILKEEWPTIKSTIFKNF